MICILFDEKTGQDEESSVDFDLKGSVMHVSWQNEVDFTECSSNPFRIFWFVQSSHRPSFFKSCTNDTTYSPMQGFFVLELVLWHNHYQTHVQMLVECL
jgi:hypothetical protein